MCTTVMHESYGSTACGIKACGVKGNNFGEESIAILPPPELTDTGKMSEALPPMCVIIRQK
ncbi:hypothetical protein GCM10009621_07910 [Corynebacterium felinum]